MSDESALLAAIMAHPDEDTPTVCERWQGEGGLANFLADMGKKPSPAHTVERIDNNAGYSPDNCVWATRTRQARNRRSSRIVSHQNESKTIAEWAEIVGIPATVISMRLNRLKWTVERSLTTPVMTPKEAAILGNRMRYDHG